MSDGQQLERSVLEGKERDELHAIADAMGLKPTSRSAKATLVTKILQAAGIEDTGENGAKKPARAAKARAAANGDEAGTAQAEPEEADAEPAPTESTVTADDAEAGDGPTEQREGRPNQQNNQGGQQQPRRLDGPGEPGNRRNRRRRGRDRGQGGGGGGGGDRGDRDLQGGGQQEQYQGEPIPVTGLLDLRDEGYGFLRTNGYLSSGKDVYVSLSQ
ncbi:MAG: transcription termination factor Rho, partial [Actinomycetota bacterium]|nr:transcription termination factor Rho [Actinomycetota bacterium]